MNDDVKSLLRELFEILEKEEESESGRIFRPTTITSVRCLDAKRLNQLMTELKRLSKE